MLYFNNNIRPTIKHNQLKNISMAQPIEEQKSTTAAPGEGEKFLYQLNKLLYKHNTNKLDHELVSKLAQYSQKILEKRRKGRASYPAKGPPKKEQPTRLTASPNEVIEEYDESMEASLRRSTTTKKYTKPKPSHLKNLAATFTSPFLSKNLLHFLEVKELLQIRLVSREFSAACDAYFPFALQREADIIYRELEDEQELNAQYMEIVQTQIPISTNDWLKLELSETLDCCLTKKDITNLKAIKKIPTEKDIIFAPFCILYKVEPIKLPTGIDPLTQAKGVSWHASALRLLSQPNFLTVHGSFERDCLPENVVLEAFEYLNREELQLERVAVFNVSLSNLIKWCQGIVAYHIITHPYKLRNYRTAPKGSPVHEFATRIDQQMDRFYAFKAFLLKTNKISKKTNFAFNLKHTKFPQKEARVTVYSLGPKELENIFQFLMPKEALAAKLVTKRWIDSVNEHWDERLIKLVQDIEYAKMVNAKRLLSKVPSLYEYGFFVNSLQMLDSILYSDNLFFSRTHLEDIKCIKKATEPMQQLFNALSTLLDIRPIRKPKPTGDVDIDYFTQMRELLIKNKFLDTIRKLDKYWINHRILQQVEEILTDPEKKLSLKSVRSVNLGLYQLLLWIKAVLTLNKLVNPLLFISADYIRKRLTPEEITLVEDIYQGIESWKVMYTVRVRSNNGKSCLANIVEEAKKRLSATSEEYATIGDTNNKITTFYFTAKDQVPIGAQPALVEKVLSEFFTGFKELDALGFESLHFTLSGPVLAGSGEIPSVTAGDILKTLKAGKKNINIDATLLDHKILAGSVLFYLDTFELRSCSLVNKHWHKGVKMHMILRAIKIIEETKEYQEENRETADRINMKRKQYYEDYEIPPPTKESALIKMSLLEAKDITNLKAVKKPSEGYEFFIAPFVILMGKGPEVKRYANNTKEISYWRSAQKIWCELNLYQKIKEFPMELISVGTFKKMQEYIADSRYNVEDATKLNPSLGKFVSWILGVYEFHQYLRKYCEREMDPEILDEGELRFLHEMDARMYNNFKIFKYVAEKCSEYKEVPFVAQELAAHPHFKLNLQQLLHFLTQVMIIIIIYHYNISNYFVARIRLNAWQKDISKCTTAITMHGTAYFWQYPEDSSSFSLNNGHLHLSKRTPYSSLKLAKWV
eukprot:TRINITY_DN135258_c1_g1_i1.p1 TRINITY_DN135258_c1_g1~~TRINITY_DN135258_c1_g1_i1.p1  ORF type:complete len:1171 (-),score=124.18 TRINITY_DN135258_c1_g1_i1:698-4153(-)